MSETRDFFPNNGATGGRVDPVYLHHESHLLAIGRRQVLLDSDLYALLRHDRFELNRFLPGVDGVDDSSGNCRIRYRLSESDLQPITAKFLVTPTELILFEGAIEQYHRLHDGEPRGDLDLRRQLLLPDPVTFPQCYRLTNDDEDPRLIILWGLAFDFDMIPLALVLEKLRRQFLLRPEAVLQHAWKWLIKKHRDSKSATDVWRLGGYLADNLRKKTVTDKKGRPQVVKEFDVAGENSSEMAAERSVFWDRTVRLRKRQLPATDLRAFRNACRDFYAQADKLGKEKPFVREMICSLRLPDPLLAGHHADCYRWQGRGVSWMPIAGKLRILPEWAFRELKVNEVSGETANVVVGEGVHNAVQPDLKNLLHPDKCTHLKLPPADSSPEALQDSEATVAARLGKLAITYGELALLAGSFALVLAALGWFIFAGLMDHESPLIGETVQTETADQVVLRFSEPVLFNGAVEPLDAGQAEEAVVSSLALFYANGQAVPVQEMTVAAEGKEVVLSLTEPLLYKDEIFAVFAGVSDRAFRRNPLRVWDGDSLPNRPSLVSRIFGKRISRAERVLYERDASLQRLPQSLHTMWTALPEEIPALAIRIEYIDVLPPGIEAVKVPPIGEENLIMVYFDEPVTADSIHASHFAVVAATTPPQSIEAEGWENALAAEPLFSSDDRNLVVGAHLRFVEGILERSREYDLFIRGVRDLAGNRVSENRNLGDLKHNPKRFRYQDTTTPELLGEGGDALSVKDPWTITVFFNKSVALPVDPRWQASVVAVQGGDPRRRVIGLGSVRLPDESAQGRNALEFTLADPDFLLGPNRGGPLYRLEFPPVRDLTGNLSEAISIGPFSNPHNNDDLAPDLLRDRNKVVLPPVIDDGLRRLKFALTERVNVPIAANRIHLKLKNDSNLLHPTSVAIESQSEQKYYLVLLFAEALQSTMDYILEIPEGTLADRSGNRNSNRIIVDFKVPGVFIEESGFPQGGMIRRPGP